ncbi:hypothetical protein KIN20_024576 [Parelaphostrongylus tenuis]|uniref:Uncharacterized protein n=1 Tax=Parelaphostrongylus tenuis TaxID=148309 RepID=A0AAD5NB96_PARTN|nr:hypothetical protein KIN20_024576 [Parelaphostrongylus tenuis]
MKVLLVRRSTGRQLIQLTRVEARDRLKVEEFPIYDEYEDVTEAVRPAQIQVPQ